MAPKVPSFCIVSVWFVFPLLMLFVFLFTGTFYTKPRLVLWGGSNEPNARPMVPVVTVITSNHWTSIVWFIAARANPDLVSPFISNHVSTDGLGDDTADRRLEGSGWGEHGCWHDE